MNLRARTDQDDIRRSLMHILQDVPPTWQPFNRDIPKLAVKAGATQGWHKHVGDGGNVIGLDRFGASAPGEVVYEKLGFRVESVIDRPLALLER